jgi:hypothetical protein
MNCISDVSCLRLSCCINAFILCILLMPYWTSLCVLRRTCRQSSLYGTLFHCNTLSDYHHHICACFISIIIRPTCIYMLKYLCRYNYIYKRSMYIDIYIYIYIHIIRPIMMVCLHGRNCVRCLFGRYMYIYKYIHTCIYINICIYIYVYMYTYICVRCLFGRCVYIYIYL